MIAGRCLAPLGQVAGLLMQYQNARTSLGSIDNYMKLPVERPVNRRVPASPGVPRLGRIPRRDVCPIRARRSRCCKNVSFKLNPGEKVGIIGRIGSGKTTLEKLIMWPVPALSEGTVLLDGVDIRQIDPADLRRAIGYVPRSGAVLRQPEAQHRHGCALCG